jgi:hypothetical protein
MKWITESCYRCPLDLGLLSIHQGIKFGKKIRLDDLKSHWKGVVRAFKRIQHGEKVGEVLIPHVYKHKEILKECCQTRKKFLKLD